MPYAESPLHDLVETVESADALDDPGKTIGTVIRDNVPQGPVKDALAGSWLGHALHPMLTDVVIGSFSSATMLDLLGNDGADRLIATGIAAYGPTAATGLNDWADSEIADERVRRVGLVHAGVNATALTLYTASLAARRKGSRGRARLLSLAGGAVLAVG